MQLLEANGCRSGDNDGFVVAVAAAESFENNLVHVHVSVSVHVHVSAMVARWDDVFVVVVSSCASFPTTNSWVDNPLQVSLHFAAVIAAAVVAVAVVVVSGPPADVFVEESWNGEETQWAKSALLRQGKPHHPIGTRSSV